MEALVIVLTLLTKVKLHLYFNYKKLSFEFILN